MPSLNNMHDDATLQIHEQFFDSMLIPILSVPNERILYDIVDISVISSQLTTIELIINDTIIFMEDVVPKNKYKNILENHMLFLHVIALQYHRCKLVSSNKSATVDVNFVYKRRLVDATVTNEEWQKNFNSIIPVQNDEQIKNLYIVSSMLIKFE